MRFRSKAPSRLLAFGAVGALLSGPLALADVVDTSTPKVLHVGTPRGPAPSERVDGGHTGRAHTALPTSPASLWSVHLSGGIEVAPLVDEGLNAIVALNVPDVVKVSREGTEVFRTRLGTQPALEPPVITSSGGIFVVTGGGQAVGLSSSGSVRFTTQLGAKARESDAPSPLALADGGVALAIGRTLIEIADDGDVRARATLDDRPVGALIASPDATLLTGESGAVYAWKPPGAPRKIGTFGGQVRKGAALADAHTLVAVVDGRRVVALDLGSGASHVRASTPLGVLLDGPPAIGATGLVYVASQAGIVVGVDAIGNERLQAVVDKLLPLPTSTSPTAGPGSAFGIPLDFKPSPAVIVDAAGRIAFARSGGRAGVVHPDGSVAVASEHLCSAPVAVVPAGDKRFLVACRDGTLAAIGD